MTNVKYKELFTVLQELYEIPADFTKLSFKLYTQSPTRIEYECTDGTAVKTIGGDYLYKKQHSDKDLVYQFMIDFLEINDDISVIEITKDTSYGSYFICAKSPKEEGDKIVLERYLFVDKEKK